VENLGFRGYETRRIASASAALETIDEIAKADLVILDIIMERPEGESSISGDRTTGMKILKKLRQKNPELPILVFSATVDRDLIDAVINNPYTEFLQKWNAPSLRDVIDRVDRALGRTTAPASPKAFIVHGHDAAEALALKNYLQNVLKFPEPIILHEQSSVSRTIIEKFEEYSTQVDLAFVLLTPDDKMASGEESNDDKRRARQNVIFELGYFVGLFGRLSGRVILLHKGNLDLPSDISGMVYIDISAGIERSGEAIRKELTHVTR
jgi:predicted nucleotide-binding protein